MPGLPWLSTTARHAGTTAHTRRFAHSVWGVFLSRVHSRLLRKSVRRRPPDEHRLFIVSALPGYVANTDVFQLKNRRA